MRQQLNIPSHTGTGKWGDRGAEIITYWNVDLSKASPQLIAHKMM